MAYSQLISAMSAFFKSVAKISFLITVGFGVFFSAINNGHADEVVSIDAADLGVSRAAWMSGGWGIRLLLPAGEKEAVYKFNVANMVAQVGSLKSLSWVMLNLTNGNDGAHFTSPNPLLEAINSGMVPVRDLLGEAMAALAEKGVRTIVYFDSRGPRVDNFDAVCNGEKEGLPYCKSIRDIQRGWKNYTHAQKMESKQAVAEYCIEYYSKRYGKLIAGWWFDAGVASEPDMYARAARSGNHDAAIAFNMPEKGRIAWQTGQKIVARALSVDSFEEDYTSGHPTPVRLKSPSWEGNERMIASMNSWNLTHHTIPHVFLPMQRGWTKGEPVFATTQIISWTLQALKADGAITWAVAMMKPEGSSLMEEFQFGQLMLVDQAVTKFRADKKESR